MASFITVDRKILKWEWYQDVKVFHLFLYFLLRANWEDGRWKGIDVKRGQLITGRLKLSKDTGLSEMEIRTCLNKLKTTSEITIKATSKYSIITVCKYDTYQNKFDNNNQHINQQHTAPATNNQPTINQQLTTNNTLNNNKEEERKGYGEFACYDAESFILGNQMIFEKICMATSKKAEEVKKELHLYHLWLAKNEKYPMGKGAVAAGIESWLLNARKFKTNYNVQDNSVPKSNGIEAAKKYA